MYSVLVKKKEDVSIVWSTLADLGSDEEMKKTIAKSVSVN